MNKIKIWWRELKDRIMLKFGYVPKTFYDSLEICYNRVNATACMWEAICDLKEKQIDIAEKSIAWWEARYGKMKKSIKTVRVEVPTVNYGPDASNFDMLKAKARAEIVKQLGEAIYPYAKHVVTENGKYIVAVSALDPDFTEEA